jgi:hypothetical protein
MNGYIVKVSHISCASPEHIVFFCFHTSSETTSQQTDNAGGLQLSSPSYPGLCQALSAAGAPIFTRRLAFKSDALSLANVSPQPRQNIILSTGALLNLLVIRPTRLHFIHFHGIKIASR